MNGPQNALWAKVVSKAAYILNVPTHHCTVNWKNPRKYGFLLISSCTALAHFVGINSATFWTSCAHSATWATYLTTPNITSGRQCILDCHNYQNRATHGTAFHMCKNGVSSILTPKEFLRALKIITTMMGQKVGLLMGFGQAIQKVEYLSIIRLGMFL